MPANPNLIQVNFYPFEGNHHTFRQWYMPSVPRVGEEFVYWDRPKSPDAAPIIHTCEVRKVTYHLATENVSVFGAVLRSGE